MSITNRFIKFYVLVVRKNDYNLISIQALYPQLLQIIEHKSIRYTQYFKPIDTKIEQIISICFRL